MIVTMVILTTSVMWALARLPMRPGEKERLEREAFEADGFAATIAGARGQPATVMHVKSRAASPTQTRLVGAGSPGVLIPSEAAPQFRDDCASL